MYLELIPLDAYNLDRLERNAAINMQEGSVESREFHSMIVTVLQETRSFLQEANAREPWISYLAMDALRGGLVGNCSFKGNPNDEGEVEIAIVTFPQFEGQGYGGEMARRMIQMARDEGGVSRINAFTLASSGAAIRLMERQGFQRLDIVHESDKGDLWEWMLDLV